MRTLHSFITRWQNWLGLFLVTVFILMALFAPLLSPNDMEKPGPIKYVGDIIDYEPKPPSQNAPLGTLSTQISVYHAFIWGSRSAIVFGLVVTILIALFGVLIGTISAYFGGFLNDILMRITDSFLAFPVIAGVVLIKQIIKITLINAGFNFYPGGIAILNSAGVFVELPGDLPLLYDVLLKIDPIFIAFILFSWTAYARIMNTAVLRIKQADYIEATRALGGGHFRLMFRHLIPNAIAPVIVLAARDVGSLVLLQATFVFIGLGEGSPWAMVLVKGRDWIYSPGGIFTYWWVFLPVTLALVLFGIGWNLLGDGLNDALNPRTN